MHNSLRARMPSQRDAVEAPTFAAARAPRRRASLAIIVLASLLAVGMTIQVFLAGLALFVDSLYWWPHHALGHSLTPAALVLLVLTLIGRQPAGVRWRAAVLVVLLVGQGALAKIRGAAGALHPVNAMLLFWLVITLVRAARSTRAASA